VVCVVVGDGRTQGEHLQATGAGREAGQATRGSELWAGAAACNMAACGPAKEPAKNAALSQPSPTETRSQAVAASPRWRTPVLAGTASLALVGWHTRISLLLLLPVTEQSTVSSTDLECEHIH
jgi:hypothetical protein